jgi:outer membrane protein assembly factor BamA
VPGTDDQVDVNYAVEEQASGSITASVGFAQSAGPDPRRLDHPEQLPRYR